METPLLTTKLIPPPVRSDRVVRPRLLTTLDACLEPDRRVALVAAPAGYGKTTLVAAWGARQAETLDLRTAWLSLDDDDNAPARFLRYLIAAIRQVAPDLGDQAQAMVSAPEPVPPTAVLTTLINDLVRAPSPLVLVLDDYHVIDTRAIHEAVTFLLDPMPPMLRVVLASRADPPIPLHRWRARRQLVEVRAADLRFTEDEAAAFLEAAGVPPLGEEDVALLTSRTEGWPVGLQMAALALREHADSVSARAFVQAFSGSHRYVLDYLLEEVVNRQPPVVRHFLLATSILSRMSGPLCDAVIGKGSAPLEDEASEAPNLRLEGTDFADSQAVLTHLERANLFVVPLDGRRVWFRYHHLFAVLLRARLHQTSPARVPVYHRRAAGWLAAHDQPLAAVRHTLAAGDLDRAADLVEAHTRDFMAQGDLTEALTWIERLPDDLVAARPWLAVEKAWAMAFAGDPAAVVSLLADAESHGEGTARLQGHITAIRAFTAVATGQVEQALSLADEADALLDEDEAWARSVMAWSRGYTYRMIGALARAEPAFRALVAYGEALDNVWTPVTGYTELTLLLHAQGRRDEALEAARAGLAVAQAGPSGRRRIPGYVGRLESALATVLWARNELEAAAQHAVAGIEQTRRWQNPNHEIYAQVVAGRIHRAQGDLDAAEAALAQAEAVGTPRAVVPILPAMVDRLRVNLRLDHSDLAAARQWADAQDRSKENSMGIAAMLRALTVAEVRVAGGDPAGALAILNPLVAKAEAQARSDLAIKARVRQALALRTQGRRDDAVDALRAALALGAPERYVRPFLDAGSALAGLLARIDGPERTYAARILRMMGAPVPEVPELRPGLIEPLTDREHEVLALMAEGLTNPEIAETLVIATGTVKAHTARIYGKLDVHNRTEAAARARELGLL